jgi:hypothetical protein
VSGGLKEELSINKGNCNVTEVYLRLVIACARCHFTDENMDSEKGR